MSSGPIKEGMFTRNETLVKRYHVIFIDCFLSEWNVELLGLEHIGEQSVT